MRFGLPTKPVRVDLRRRWMLQQTLCGDVKIGGLSVGQRVERDVLAKRVGHVDVGENRFPRALWRAHRAVDALRRIDEQLPRQVRLTLRRSVLEDAILRTNIDARAVHAITAQACNDEGHD